MAGDFEEDWSPDLDKEERKLRREQLEVAREALRLAKERQEQEQAERKRIEEAGEKLKKEMGEPAYITHGDMARAYQPPLLSALLDRYVALWKEICVRVDDPELRKHVFGLITSSHQPFRLNDDDVGRV